MPIVKLRKYEYELKLVPQTSEKVGGCLGCFFCKQRSGYWRQTCVSVKDHDELIKVCTEQNSIYEVVSRKPI